MNKSTASTRLTAITGGIGAGKSVVSRILCAMGYPVYDCDSRAKTLMNTDPGIRAALAEAFGAEILTPGGIDRDRLGAIVFADPERLHTLNKVVHGAVRLDLERWCGEHLVHTRLFVETAILAESGLDAMVGSVWEVVAPVELRVERVMRRNALTRDQVEARIAAQRSGAYPGAVPIVNDGIHPLLIQVRDALSAGR